jgi:general secretion pathway protein G
MRQRRRARYYLRGYTLTEMMIVLVIIGLIASLIVPQTLGQMGRAKVRAAKLQLEHVAVSLELFSADARRYPSIGEGLMALLVRPPGLQDWTGPYLRPEETKDPWGQTILYEQPASDGERPRVRSLGADRRDGGEGLNMDIIVGGSDPVVENQVGPP